MSSEPVVGGAAEEATPQVGPADLRSLVLGDRPQYTPIEASARTGVDLDLASRLWRSMGLAQVPDDAAVFSDQDLDALVHAASTLDKGLLTRDELLQLARVLGQATSRIADSVIGLTFEGVGHPDERPMGMLDELDRLVVYLLNRHVLDAISRHFALPAGEQAGLTTAVGFADLVGFTRLSQRLDERELGAVVDRFEALASDTVVDGGGRVIKMIGDEVMWYADPAPALEIALELSESFQGDELSGVRVGLASGGVIVRAGDLFGPTVNLASRATALARPRSVLVSADLFDVAAANPAVALRRMRPRRLKGIGWSDLGVLSRAAPHHRGSDATPAPGAAAGRSS